MKAAPEGNNALVLVNRLVELGVEGKAPGMKTSIELAEQYADDARYSDDEARIRSLIRRESSKSFTSGFATGLGGLITLPVTLPAGVGTAWVIQARMVGAIAHLRGYDVEDERVRSLAIACLVGESAVSEAVKAFGNDLAIKAANAAVARVPGKVLININRKVGFRLITKAGSKGVVNLTKMVPIAGGVVGGTVDGAATRAIGATAKHAFPPRRPPAAAVVWSQSDPEPLPVEVLEVATTPRA